MTRTRELRALLELARAQLASRSAQVRFRDTDRSTVERVVDVLALAFESPRWIVATWSADRGSLRVLDLARILRVRPTRRRAGVAPEGFDPVYFAVRSFLDPDGGPPRPTTIRLEPPWAPVARALVPWCDVEPEPGGALLHVHTTRPEIMDALAESLSTGGALHFARRPWPNPARRRSLTRRASSASPPGSSRSPSPSPAPSSSRRSPTTMAGGPTRPSGSSRGTRTR